MVKKPGFSGTVSDKIKKPFPPKLFNLFTINYVPYSYWMEGTEVDVGTPLSLNMLAGASTGFSTSWPSFQPFYDAHPDVPQSAIRITRWTLTLRCITDPPDARVGVIANDDGAWYSTPQRKSIGRFTAQPPRPPNGEFLLGYEYLTPIPIPGSWTNMSYTFVNAAPGDELSWDRANFGRCTVTPYKGQVTLTW